MMQREIKFRAWNTVWKCMYQLIGFKLAGKKHTQLYYVDADGDSTTCAVLTENIILLQYTGLHDKNGKEIYEGDIIRWGDKTSRENGDCEIVTVAWSGGSFCVKDKRETLHEFFHYFSHSWNDMPYTENGEYMNIQQYFRDTFEVIGNIYENPELLNQQTTGAV